MASHQETRNARQPASGEVRRRFAAREPAARDFRDGRILQGIAQIIFVAIVVLVLNNLQTRINTALESTNQSPNFEFLQNRAGFDIADSGSYSSNDRYIDAFRVGFINTIRVVLIGLVATTVLGIMVGIFLLSRNFLLRTISRAYVEILRNTPSCCKSLLGTLLLYLRCHSSRNRLPSRKKASAACRLCSTRCHSW